MEKKVAPNQGRQVQCYMDIKIGPRFAGRMVFEVRPHKARASHADAVLACAHPQQLTTHSRTALYGLHAADGRELPGALHGRAVRLWVMGCLHHDVRVWVMDCGLSSV